MKQWWSTLIFLVYDSQRPEISLASNQRLCYVSKFARFFLSLQAGLNNSGWNQPWLHHHYFSQGNNFWWMSNRQIAELYCINCTVSLFDTDFPSELYLVWRQRSVHSTVWESISTTCAHITLKAAENDSKVVRLKIIVLLHAEELKLRQSFVLISLSCWLPPVVLMYCMFTLLCIDLRSAVFSIHSGPAVQTQFPVFSLGIHSPKRPQK